MIDRVVEGLALATGGNPWRKTVRMRLAVAALGAAATAIGLWLGPCGGSSPDGGEAAKERMGAAALDGHARRA